MNTFRANLLPCAGTAGGAPAQPSAAGRLSIVVRADRPGAITCFNFLGLGRAIQPSEQTARGLTDRFQVNHSLRDAPASEMQETTEGIPDERKPTARDGNLTARERKNAC